MARAFDRFRVIDADTHVSEPEDLWTSRVSSKWGDLVPHVVPDPNVAGFGSGRFLRLGEPELMLECVRAYNDFMTDWCSPDPERLIGVKRQIYGCFWFEEASARVAIDEYRDNVLYETDFPHPTSMSPGPASAAEHPADYVERVWGELPEPTLLAILHDNAARVYHVS